MHLNDGTTVAGDALIFDCIQMWAQELIRLDIIPQIPSIDPRSFRDPGSGIHPSITIACEEGEPMEAKPLLLALRPDTLTLVPATTQKFDAEVDLHWRIYTSRFSRPRLIKPHPPTTIRFQGGEGELGRG